MRSKLVKRAIAVITMMSFLVFPAGVFAKTASRKITVGDNNFGIAAICNATRVSASSTLTSSYTVTA